MNIYLVRSKVVYRTPLPMGVVRAVSEEVAVGLFWDEFGGMVPLPLDASAFGAVEMAAVAGAASARAARFGVANVNNAATAKIGWRIFMGHLVRVWVQYGPLPHGSGPHP